jgi:o-succinylbenzoate synthase
MRIDEISAEPLDLELTEPFGIATGAQTAVRNVLISVRLSDGSVGLGEAAPFPAVSGETQAAALDAVNIARPVLSGRDPRTWRRLAHELAEALPSLPSARTGFETAVLDALCRSVGLPLWALFGGVEAEIETDLTIVTGSIEAARAAAVRAVGWGFSVLKVKIGGTDVDRDVERLRAIADAAPRARLVLDANASLSAAEAVAIVDALGPLASRIVLFEQPTARDDIDAMAVVAQRTRIPIAADESARSAADIVALARRGAASVINLKTAKCGIAQTLDMAATARSLGLGLMIGGMVETELAMTASACLAAGIGGFMAIDLDTPRFLARSPFSASDWGPRIRVGDIAVGHGVTCPRGPERPETTRNR